MEKSAPTYLSIAVLVAAATAISQFPSSTATSDIDAGDVSSPIAAEVTGIGKRAEEEKARIDKENEEKARRAAAEARLRHNSICENLDGVDNYWVDTANRKLSILPESLIGEESAFKYTFTVHSHYDSTELFAEAFWRFYTDKRNARCELSEALCSHVARMPCTR